MTMPEQDLLRSEPSGVFGLEDVVRDFDPRDVERLRAVAALVRTPPRDGVRSAIALAGSAAQSRFQPWPGDCDLFERVHIAAPAREDAIATLVATLVETIARAFPHPQLQFAELKCGLHQGAPISWSLADVDSRSIRLEGALTELVEAAVDPGFLKLDWVLADPERDRLMAVSKVIDATWEAPDGTITALDGVLDSFYQEVYLDPDSKVDVERLIQHVRPDGLQDYVAQLEHEVCKYSEAGHENYGKVAKRLYNLCRVGARSDEAARLRGIFDDPPARLYSLPGALHALEPALRTRRLDREVMAAQLGELQQVLRDVYAGDDLEELCAQLEGLPASDDAYRERVLPHVSERVTAEVSAYFRARIEEDPALAAYVDEIRSAAASGR